MTNILENLIESFIRDGIVTESELEQRVEEAKKNSPLSPIKADMTTLSEKTNGMQVIDNFTLGKTSSLEEKASGLQAVDNFALQRINELEAKITELETKLGGNA
jgi:hypothetical protein